MYVRSCLILVTLPLGAMLFAADQGQAAPPVEFGATANAGAGPKLDFDAGVRFFVDAAPTYYEDAYGYEDEFDSGVRMGVMAIFRGGASEPGDVGFFGGFGLSYTGYSQAFGANDFTLTEFGMDFQLGAYIPVAPMFEIEVGFDMGFGTATGEFGSYSTDSGSYVLFDFFVRPSLMMTDGFNAYLTLGYQTQVVTLYWAGYDEELSITGAYFGLGVGLFF